MHFLKCIYINCKQQSQSKEGHPAAKLSWLVTFYFSGFPLNALLKVSNEWNLRFPGRNLLKGKVVSTQKGMHGKHFINNINNKLNKIKKRLPFLDEFWKLKVNLFRIKAGWGFRIGSLVIVTKRSPYSCPNITKEIRFLFTRNFKYN